MTTTTHSDPKLLTGYPMDQLAAAFDRIRDPDDWMAPIAAELAVTDRHLVEMAVLWFTNSLPRFHQSLNASERVLVEATGYRGGPYGDGAGRLHPEPRAGGRGSADGWELGRSSPDA